MPLVIEDGTGLPNASSYVSAAETLSYAEARGAIVSDDTEVLEAALVKALDYLEAQRARYQGSKTNPGVQALQWPRVNVILDCDYALPSNVIPVELKRAQMQAALEVLAGRDLMPSSDGRVVKKEKVDVIETEYMTSNDLGPGATTGPSFPALDALLEALYTPCGGGFFLKTVRV